MRSMREYNDSDFVRIGRSMGLIPSRRPNLTDKVMRDRRTNTLRMTHGMAHQDMPPCYRSTATWTVDSLERDVSLEGFPCVTASLSLGKVSLGVSMLAGETMWAIDSYWVDSLPTWSHGTGTRAGLRKRWLAPESLPARMLSASVRLGRPATEDEADPEPHVECEGQGLLSSLPGWSA